MKKFTFIIVLLAVVLAVGAQKRPKAIVKLEKQLVGKFVEIPAGHYTEVVYNDTGQVVLYLKYLKVMEVVVKQQFVLDVWH